MFYLLERNHYIKIPAKTTAVILPVNQPVELPRKTAFLMFPDVSPIAERGSHGGAVKPV